MNDVNLCSRVQISLLVHGREQVMRSDLRACKQLLPLLEQLLVSRGS